MTVTWREQIVAFCVLLVARIFADDAQLKQDLRNLSNRITTQQPANVVAAAAPPPMAPADEFQLGATHT